MNKLHIQPCWTCKKCYGGCSWSRKDPRPVFGWEATPTVKKGSHTASIMHSYAIHKCPEYEWDGTEVCIGM